jgi:hypothetical protein
MLMEGGSLAPSVGRVIGVGPGRGIGFMFILFGCLPIAVGVLGYLSPRLRQMEDELPDADPEGQGFLEDGVGKGEGNEPKGSPDFLIEAPLGEAEVVVTVRS